MTMEHVISERGQAELLRIARLVLEAAAKDESVPDCQPDNLPELDQHLGAFVTLHERGQLRGCIGRFLPNEPVWQVVKSMALAAATEDPRFRPVGPNDPAIIKIEISVLSPLFRTKDPLSLELGKHGIYIRRGGRSGTFLPQVATECEMTKEEFLGSCCAHKAGLSEDAWKDPATEVYLYTAQVFSEE